MSGAQEDLFALLGEPEPASRASGVGGVHVATSETAIASEGRTGAVAATAVCDPCAEVGSMPVALMAKLPLGTTLLCEVGDAGSQRLIGEGAAGCVVVSWCKASYEAARTAGLPVLRGGELAAMALAARNDRATAATLRRWIDRKRKTGEWSVTLAVALDGLSAEKLDKGSDGYGDMTVSATLAGYGARVVDVGVGDAEGLALVTRLATAGASRGREVSR